MQRTRADQILDGFETFHKANPRIWRLFQKFALEVISSGKKRYSSDCVCHRIRWHTSVETKGEEVKINNNYTAYYARMFHLAYSQHHGLFGNRRIISEDSNAFNDDIKVFNTGPPDLEKSIVARLSALIAIEDNTTTI